MRILALELSTGRPSVAVVDADQAAQSALPKGQPTAAWLHSAVQQLLKDRGCQSGDVELLAVTAGPGSFTGLRIAVTFAKLFCYATAAPLVALDSLDVLAAAAASRPDGSGPLYATMDALRRELFYAAFDVTSKTKPERTTPTCVTRTAEFLERMDRPSCVVGMDFGDALPPQVTALPANSDTAICLARLAQQRFAAGQRDDIWALVPQYHRKSYAEQA